MSSTAGRRSRCGSVRGWPVLSSHFSPGFAPQVGQRTANAFFGSTFMATACAVLRQNSGQLCPVRNPFLLNTDNRLTANLSPVFVVWPFLARDLKRELFSPEIGKMALPITVFPNRTLEVVSPRLLAREMTSAPSVRWQSQPSLPSRIAVIGNYLPRHCGIATFTTDLCSAIADEYGTARLMALPVNDTEEGYDYPARVRWSLAQDDVKSYQDAAEFLNFNNVDMVCLQHEYGIFGGPAGSHILHLLRNLKMPLVTTLHTVLREPDPNQMRVMEEIAELSDRLIVMSQLSSQFLQEIFKVPGSKIDMVPHGVPDLPFLDPNFYKDRFGVEGKAVLLTFGLLSPNKGIENVIQALPTPTFSGARGTSTASRCRLWRRKWESNRRSSSTIASSVPRKWLSSSAPLTSISPLIGMKRRLFPEPWPTHWAPARRSSPLPTGTPSNCWTTGAARWCHLKIPTPSRKKPWNYSTLLRFVMPCANARTCSRGKWSGSGWRRVTWRVSRGSAATAWRIPGSSPRLASLTNRWIWIWIWMKISCLR